ncbi:trbC/VIRB2 family protein [Wolbachia endosymbiont of Wuchereria bancrofti]|nr:trbC/VIRB2 family protein [Wolbachia endosymbiont of Wuchereria bancrofti]
MISFHDIIYFFSDIGNADTKSGTNDNITAQVICNIIDYVWGIGGPLITVVMIGAALFAIFGRIPWSVLLH